MPGNTHIPKRVKVKYEYAPDYISTYANGAWGGVTSNNEIRMELYNEMPKYPDGLILEVNPNGTLGKELERTPALNTEEPEFKRIFLVGVTFKIEVAESIANWLLGKVNEAKGEQK